MNNFIGLSLNQKAVVACLLMVAGLGVGGFLHSILLSAIGAGALLWLAFVWLPNHTLDKEVCRYRAEAMKDGFGRKFDEILDIRMFEAQMNKLKFTARHVQSVFDEARFLTGKG